MTGDLIFEAHRLINVSWTVSIHPAPEIAPDQKAKLNVIYPVSDRFAESLAYKPHDRSFHVDFSEMKFEIAARDRESKELVIGYVDLGGKQNIQISDHVAFQRIRAFVNWRESLGDDDRIYR